MPLIRLQLACTSLKQAGTCNNDRGEPRQKSEGVIAHDPLWWHGGLLSGWLPVLRSRSLVLVSGIYKGSAALALHFPLQYNVLFFRL